MILVDFIYTYFRDWKITSICTCGTKCGYLKLRKNNTFVKIYFNLNGKSQYWCNHCTTVDHVDVC